MTGPGRRRGAAILLVPGVLFLVIFFVYPIAGMLGRSLTGVIGEPSLEAYGRILDQPAYLQVLATTFRISLVVTVITLVLGYPLAYFLSRLAPRAAALLLVLVVFPFFTSTLVRTYAWIVLLGNEGVLNQLLRGLDPAFRLQLLYNEPGVLIGMSYILLPYMVLALYSVMRGIDRDLLRAAASVGAGPLRSFVRVFLPLSLPGVAGGALLVFILGLGFFITPALMGGPRETMVAMVIEQRVEQLLDWSFASALSVVLLGLTIVGFAAYDRLVGMERLFESRA